MKSQSKMSRLERSMSSSVRDLAFDSTQPLSRFLEDMVLFMQDFVDGKLLEIPEEEQV